MQKRLLLLEALFLLGAFCVGGRLFFLQVFKHGEYGRLAYHQQFTPKETDPSRGIIEDRSDDVLAMNIDLFNVCAHPDQIVNKPRAAAVLSDALGMPYGAVLSKISGTKSFVWLARQVPYERSQLVENLKLKGVEAFRDERRFYPDHDMASHVLGFAGLDDQGLDGLECYYNKSLAGKSGMMMAERDARGRVVLADDKQVKTAVQGLNVVTTLDKTLQHIAQVELLKAYEKYRCQKASVAVMDPKTGEILAMANYPTFDPNDYGASPRDSWKNRMVNDEFEPGSTFKLIAAVGALEEGVVNEDDKFFCENGRYKTDYGRVVTDHEKYGWLTFREIFGYSSNIGMVKVSAKLGEKNLYRTAKKFGIGDLTGIDLPGEADGKIRPLKDWSGISMTTIPYGYEVSTTPIQMLAAYAAIANGGVLMRPYVVKRLERPDGTVVREFGPHKIRRACSAKTARRITQMLKWVVEKGTGTMVALPAYPIAGKTGTAYKFVKGRYSTNSYVSSFIGFVPADNPKFAIYVSLDDPRGIYWGGYTAGPVFKEVAKRALAYAMVPSSDENGVIEADNAKRRIPSFLGLTPDQSRWLAEENGLRLKFSGQGTRVVEQSRQPGETLASTEALGSQLALTLGEPAAFQAKGVMPDLRGKTKRQALALLAPLGMRVSFKGEGIVRSQFPPAGRSVQGQAPCELSCDVPATRAADAGPLGGRS